MSKQKHLMADPSTHTRFEIARLKHKDRKELSKLKQDEFINVLLDSHETLETLKEDI